MMNPIFHSDQQKHSFVSSAYADELAEEELYAASATASAPFTTMSHSSQQTLSVSQQSSKQKLNSSQLSRPSIQSVMTWLKDNYEEFPGCNTSRESLFNDYSMFAQSQGLSIMNSASFGKLIRTVFPGISTRRLGVRGQSKYHYNGIRPKASAESNSKDYLMDGPARALSDRDFDEMNNSSFTSYTNTSTGKRPRHERPANGNTTNSERTAAMTSPGRQRRRNSLDVTIPTFPVVPEVLLVGNGAEQIREFIDSYQAHCTDLLRMFNKQTVEKMETVLNGYWKGLDAQTMEMLQTSFLAKYVCDCDIHLYSSILNAVHSESLNCAASEDQSVGGKHCDLLVSFFDHWLNAALATVPEVLRVTKLQVAKCFTLSLHRATALMTSASQANALLNSDYLLHQMVADWGKLDMENINEYVGWSCQWQEDFLFAVENDIVSLLHRKASLSNWTTWLNSLIQRSVNFPMLHEPYDLGVVEHNARQFVAKFAFFTSQVLRDIAIRSVNSFGSYHTLRMFLDEYIWYMVTKNLSILKINHLIKLGLHFYPVWNNGILFHHLEQRHFFGSPLAATVGHSGAQAGVVVVDGADLMHHHHHQMDSNNAASHRLESFSSMLARSSSMESISCVGGSGGESYNSAIIDNEEERHYPFKLTQSNQ